MILILLLYLIAGIFVAAWIEHFDDNPLYPANPFLVILTILTWPLVMLAFGVVFIVFLICDLVSRIAERM